MPNKNCSGQDYEIKKGVAYSSAKIKVKCKDCKYNSYLICEKFPRKEFTGKKSREVYKDDLNPTGKCKYYKKKEAFLQRIFRIKNKKT